MGRKGKVMIKEDNKNKKKREYQRPELRVIELAAEEVLAVGCKLTTPRPASGNPTYCRWPSKCVQTGTS